MKTITQGKDAVIRARLTDKNGVASNITGWSYIEMKFQETNGVLKKYAPLTTSVDEIQRITASDTPDSGTFTIGLMDQTTSAINWDADASAIQAAINALNGISGVTVSGAWPVFDATFAGNSGGRDWALMVLTSALKKAAADVDLTPTEETKGIPKNGIEVVYVHPATIDIYLSEDDTDDLQSGDTDIIPTVRIGESDLNIPPQLAVIRVEEAPF